MKFSVKSLTALAALLGASVLLAGGAARTEPWDERAIPPSDAAMPAGRLDRQALEALTARGESLFAAQFTTADGVGRPLATQAIIPTKRKRAANAAFQRMSGMDANACSGCHNVPRIGGAGDFAANVFVSEGFDHAEFDTIDPQFSNERNTNHLFGAGLVEMLAREMTSTLQALRGRALREARASGSPQTIALEAKGVRFGSITANPDGVVDLSQIKGVDTDLVIRPFSHKGVMTSLRQFSVNALNHHHGMQATERFGARWTGEDDYDGDDVADEISPADVSALVAWQATLPPPLATTPKDGRWAQMAERGRSVFNETGCAVCHVPELPLDSLAFADPGPFDAAGTLRDRENGEPAIYDLAMLPFASRLRVNEKGQVMVPLFGDLKRHVISDQQVAALGNETLAQRFVERDVFQTTELWGVASTGPYGHRGDFTTLGEVILAHGGDARQSRDAFHALAQEDRDALIAFLKTLDIAP